MGIFLLGICFSALGICYFPIANIGKPPMLGGQAMARRKSSNNDQSNGSHLGFEATLWATADKLRGNLDAAVYKHVVLGLIFLNYIPDAFEEKHAALLTETGANPEDRDEYLADNIFWVPKVARRSENKGKARQPNVDILIDMRIPYADCPGFCKSAKLEEIRSHGHVLTPGRYVGAEEVEDNGEPFEKKMARLVAELNGQFAESAKLVKPIRQNLKGVGYAG